MACSDSGLAADASTLHRQNRFNVIYQCYRIVNPSVWLAGMSATTRSRITNISGCSATFRRIEHPFGTMKARMRATHFLTKTLPNVAAEMALSVLAYNLTRVMNIVGTRPLMAAIVA